MCHLIAVYCMAILHSAVHVTAFLNVSLFFKYLLLVSSGFQQNLQINSIKNVASVSVIEFFLMYVLLWHCGKQLQPKGLVPL